MKTYIDVLNETVAFYSEDVSRRSVSEDGRTCLYNGPNGRQCAVARCAEPIDAEHEGEGVWALIEHKGMKLFKPEYRHLNNPRFWYLLQTLHDNGLNWTKSGLSFAGESKVKDIIYEFKNK